jgi:putative ABC transport system permease protein
MNELVSDFRYGVRALRRAPLFAAAAVLTLAIGIGANTAIFSVVNAALLRPLPYPGQNRVLDVSSTWEGSPRSGVSPAEYFDYRETVGAPFGALAAYATGALNLVGVGDPVRLRTGFVTPDLFDALGVAPVAGRPFTADEDASDALVVLISHGLWVRQFGRDAGVVGRQVTLSGRGWEVIGVLPPDFRLPDDYADGQVTELVAPLGLDPSSVAARGSHFLRVVGRLVPGRSREDAQLALAGIAGRFVRDFPGDYPRDMAFAVTAVPVAERVVGGARRPLVLLLGAAGFVLLVACANVANLMLVRLDARRAELAVRTALGAGRGRIVRQLFVESTVVALAGAALGVAVAWWGLQLLLALQPPDLPRFGEVTVDLTVLAFATATALLTALLFGLLPALRVADLRTAAVLRSGGRSATRGRHRLRRGLVVGQIAIAMGLLAGAALFGRSLAALRAVDPGFREDRVLTGRLTAASANYPEEPQVVDFFRAVAERVAAQPGVIAVGAVTNLPLASSIGDLNIRIEGRERVEGEVSPRGDWQVVTPGYFEAMGLTVLRGRALDERDRTDAPGAVVINRTMAERYWPGQDPLGTRFMLGGNAGPGWVTIVGIAGDVRHGSLADPPTSQMYLSHAQFRFWNGGSVVRSLTLVVRANGDPAALGAAVRGALGAVDPRVPLDQVQTMSEVVSASLGRERFLFVLAGTFGVVALVLGALGIYGVLAYAVARRTREIGLRMALGARAGDVTSMVTREGGVMVALGLAIGLAGTMAFARVLRGLLFDISPLDPLALAVSAFVLATAALVAAWVPARRAARIPPMEALRHD